MGMLDLVKKSNPSGGTSGGLIRLVLRFLQFVLAITVAGLYGVDLDAARKAHAYTDGKWVFAEVVAGLSAITCLCYGLLPFLASETLFFWDWLLFLLWTALFGIFGKLYIPANPSPKQTGQIRMKHAVWVDLACMILWFLTALYATVSWYRGRRERTLHTGRAKV